MKQICKILDLIRGKSASSSFFIRKFFARNQHGCIYSCNDIYLKSALLPDTVLGEEERVASKTGKFYFHGVNLLTQVSLHYDLSPNMASTCV